MMEKQSLDFIKGYVFSKIEGQIIHAHVNKIDRIPVIYVNVPKFWFGLRPIKSELEDLSISARFNLLASLGELCQAYNTEQTTHIIDISIEPDEQYIRFTFEGYKLPTPKEMTIAEIEEKLGYKIKIVGEHE